MHSYNVKLTCQLQVAAVIWNVCFCLTVNGEGEGQNGSAEPTQVRRANCSHFPPSRRESRLLIRCSTQIVAFCNLQNKSHLTLHELKRINPDVWPCKSSRWFPCLHISSEAKLAKHKVRYKVGHSAGMVIRQRARQVFPIKQSRTRSGTPGPNRAT